MAKFNLPKKTIKQKLLLCILHHNKKINLTKLIDKLQFKLIDEILVVNDGINYFLKKKKYKKVKFLFRKKKIFSIPINRNIALKYAKNKNFDLILFLDSDIIPLNKLVENHINSHKKKFEFLAIGGPVLPSFSFNKINFWEFLDGRLSWFTSIDKNFSHEVKWPYHLPACNLSLKVKEIFKKGIKFKEYIETGEDADLFNQIRKKKAKAFFDKNCKVKHDDRKSFLSFFNHHLKWGRHQYYNFFNINNNKIFNFLFIIFFPFILPFLALLQTFFVIKKWYLKNILYILLTPLFFLIFCFKSFATYCEGYNNFFR